VPNYWNLIHSRGIKVSVLSVRTDAAPHLAFNSVSTDGSSPGGKKAEA
jgi:hypothetical protein